MVSGCPSFPLDVHDQYGTTGTSSGRWRVRAIDDAVRDRDTAVEAAPIDVAPGDPRRAGQLAVPGGGHEVEALGLSADRDPAGWKERDRQVVGPCGTGRQRQQEEDNNRQSPQEEHVRLYFIVVARGTD